MKTVQITIDPELLQAIDEVCGSRGRSAFFRDAAQLLLRQLEREERERRDREGYLRHPVERGDFDVWHPEQVWPD